MNGGGKPGSFSVAGRKRWDRSQYPENWEELSEAVREAHDYTCEHCGTARGTLRVSRAGKSYLSKVVAAHRYPNDTRNPRPDLLCLCERCHFAYDGQFRGIMEEGRHQAALHALLIARFWEQEREETDGQEEMSMWNVPNGEANTELVCCSCGVGDASLAWGCGNCGRPVHYRESECGAWLFNPWHIEGGEFWCVACLENGLP